MYSIDESLSDTDFTPAEVVAQAFGTGRRYESITVHHWGSFGQTHMGVVAFFLKPNSPTSCHFVASDGLIHCLVSPLNASWAAGNAYGNATSIHIEARPEATDGDYATVAWLIAHLRSIYGDLPLKPHSDWAATACPGKWDLARLDREARNNPAPQTIQEDEMSTLSAITNEAMANLNGMVTNAVKNATAPILERLTATQKSVAFQEKFNVKMLERIAETVGTSITPEDLAAIRASVREELASGVNIDVTVGGTK